MASSTWNLPNKITMARLVLTAVVIALLSANDVGEQALWIAFGLFVFAAATDWLDGYLARKLNQVTALGRVLDPFVDKLLITGTMIAVQRHPSAQEVLPAWAVAVIVGREFFVTALRGHAESVGFAFPADRLGKLKMVAQSVAVPAVLLHVLEIGWATNLAEVTVLLTLVLTIWSGLNYAWKARELF